MDADSTEKEDLHRDSREGTEPQSMEPHGSCASAKREVSDLDQLYETPVKKLKAEGEETNDNLTTRKLKPHNSAPEDAERKLKKKAKQDESASSQDADSPKTSDRPEDVAKPLPRRAARVQEKKTKPEMRGVCGSGSAGVVSTTPARAAKPSAQPAAEMTGVKP